MPPYTLDALKFAFSYKVYLRWHTHSLRPLPALASLTLPEFSALAEGSGIHVLEVSADSSNLMTLVSLPPTESVSVCASKLKGRLSKWLRERMKLKQPENLLGRGYFACTSGKNTKDAVIGYLDKQAAHHHYAQRALPPV